MATIQTTVRLSEEDVLNLLSEELDTDPRDMEKRCLQIMRVNQKLQEAGLSHTFSITHTVDPRESPWKFSLYLHGRLTL